MADDSEFIAKLISFGLNEKEAQLYLHLLKYGSKPASLLAKSLKTYREDVHRILVSLIDKGMVNPSLDSPTVYTAVELEIALDAMLKKHHSEHREMEIRKRELEELSKQYPFRPSDEFATYKIIKSVKELFTFSTKVFDTAAKDIAFVLPAYALQIASTYGDHTIVTKVCERGVLVRGITNISRQYLDIGREYADLYRSCGYELRHFEKYRGMYFIVRDKKECVSAINIDITRHSLDESISMLWTDDLTYADYLMCTFEILWQQSVQADDRIRELLDDRSS